MTEPRGRTHRLEVELVPDADPISGRVRDTDGTERSFDGWLELVELLDRARISRPRGASGSTSADKAGERETR